MAPNTGLVQVRDSSNCLTSGESISSLQSFVAAYLCNDRQHLKRVHRAPVHCLRCFTVMDTKALAAHLNEVDRCEQIESSVEGLDQEKMDLIYHFNETYDDIYSTIFPGAKVSSPCKFANGATSVAARLTDLLKILTSRFHVP